MEPQKKIIKMLKWIWKTTSEWDRALNTFYLRLPLIIDPTRSAHNSHLRSLLPPLSLTRTPIVAHLDYSWRIIMKEKRKNIFIFFSSDLSFGNQSTNKKKNPISIKVDEEIGKSSESSSSDSFTFFFPSRSESKKNETKITKQLGELFRGRNDRSKETKANQIAEKKRFK